MSLFPLVFMNMYGFHGDGHQVINNLIEKSFWDAGHYCAKSRVLSFFFALESLISIHYNVIRRDIRTTAQDAIFYY
jgi:hypothetical protein